MHVLFQDDVSDFFFFYEDIFYRVFRAEGARSLPWPWGS